VTALVATLAVAVVLLGVLVAGLLRSHAEILRALHDLGVDLDPAATSRPTLRPGPGAARGTSLGPATDITGVGPAMESLTVSVTGPGRLTLLAFLSSGCLTCGAFWDAFGRRDLDVPGDARVVLVTRGPDGESPADVARLAPREHVTVMANEAWDAYGVPGSPYFVLVDGERATVIGEGTGSTWSQVQRLMRSALADSDIDTATSHTRSGQSHQHARITESPDSGPRVDAALRDAGIGPGHPSLYSTAPVDHDHP
jgi:hypothetical protein